MSAWWESACKPGSVENDHSSGTFVTERLERPTREHLRAAGLRTCRALSYLVLHRMGFTLPPLLPDARCALTAPFQPYQPRRTSAVYFLWHFPSARAAQVLPGTLPYGARTFLRSEKRQRSSGQLPQITYVSG